MKIATGVTPPSIYNIWLHVAHDRGFFRDNGIDVTEFIQLRGGPLAIQAIAAGQVDVAPADPEGLLAAVASGHPLRGRRGAGRPAVLHGGGAQGDRHRSPTCAASRSPFRGRAPSRSI